MTSGVITREITWFEAQDEDNNVPSKLAFFDNSSIDENSCHS